MNVFDFDKTIFHGDSTAKFYKYCIVKYPSVLKHLPSMACAFAGYYIFKKGTKTQCKEIFYRFLREIPDVDKAVEDFWSKNFDGIFDWYNKIHDSSDIVISASPEFLLEGVCQKLGVAKMMASPTDETISDLITDGCNMGVKSLNRYLNEYKAAEETAKDITKRLINLEEKLAIDIREYL